MSEQNTDKLIQAVIKGDIELAISLLENSASIHITTARENNLLFLAASRNQVEMFNWLLEVEQGGKKIDINHKNIDGNSLIIEFSKELDYEYYLVKLLEAGANPNSLSSDKTSALIYCVQNKSLIGCEALIKHNVDKDYSIPTSKVSALLSSTAHLNVEITELLLNNNVDINQEDIDGRNALIAALSSSTSLLSKSEKAQHKRICNLLCDQPFDFNRPANSGITPLWAACLNQNYDIIEHILSKPGTNADVWHNIDLSNGLEFGQTSGLHLLLINDKTKITLLDQMLLAGAKLGASDSNGNKPESFGFNNPKYFDWLIANNADINAQLILQSNNTTTHIPIVNHIIKGGTKQLQNLQKLISMGVKLDYSDSTHNTQHPILMALSSGSFDVIKTLISSKQINLNKDIEASIGQQTITPFMALVGETIHPLLKSYLQQKKKLEFLLEKNEEATKNNQRGNLSQSQLDKIQAEINEIAQMEVKIKSEQSSLFDLMLDNGVNINQTNSENRHALFFVQTKEFAQRLLDNGINVDQEDSSCNTAFLHSFLNKKIEVIDTLIPYYQSKNPKVLERLFYDLAFLNFDSAFQQNAIETSIYHYIRPYIDQDEFEKNKDYKINLLNINYQDNEGNHPALIASANNSPFLVSIYLKLGANLDLQNNLGETCLMHAVNNENYSLVDYLIKQKVNIGARTTEGKTALDFASEMGNESILDILREAIYEQAKIQPPKPHL